MTQKFPVNAFKWVENESQFNEDFIENFNEDSGEGDFLEVQYLEKLQDVENDLPFLPERMKTKKVGKLIANLHDKKNMSYAFKASIKSSISVE